VEKREMTITAAQLRAARRLLEAAGVEFANDGEPVVRLRKAK
jgi:hypothetical protein